MLQNLCMSMPHEPSSYIIIQILHLEKMFIVLSGETADTLNALRYCKERGALIVGVTNTGTAGIYQGN